MTDIVHRLRLIDPNQVLLMEPPHDTRYAHAGLICHEAAAEIERLRAENAMITLENARLMRQIYDGAIRARGER
jgi:hypothetical protein